MQPQYIKQIAKDVLTCVCICEHSHLTVKPHKGQIHSIFVADSNMNFKFQNFNGSMTHGLQPLFSPCP